MMTEEFEAIEAIVRLADEEAEKAQLARARALNATTATEAAAYRLTAQMHADHVAAYYAQADAAWTSQIRAAMQTVPVPVRQPLLSPAEWWLIALIATFVGLVVFKAVL
jgi:hypothetical protein